MNITKKFFELIQITLGSRDGFSETVTDEEWSQLFGMSQRQALTSVLFGGMEKVLSQAEGKKPGCLLQWFAMGQRVKALNELQNQRARELTELFASEGMCSCVLKGQGTALYYDAPEFRQCGDIDLWVDAAREDILNVARRRGAEIESVDIKHSDIHFFKDVAVEVHFRPSWMYNPMTDRRLQRFFREKAERQFGNQDARLGFAHTTIDFDLVFSIVHIYRHIFSEGIGLRQLMDYYFILRRSTNAQREEAMRMLGRLRMSGFVGGVMWILVNRFGLLTEYSLCETNERHGRFLLNEILIGGNFGHYDQRVRRVDYHHRFARGWVQLRKNLRFVWLYPSEVLWSPFWKLWHYGWRKRHGYL